jgi:hypothetical protein
MIFDKNCSSYRVAGSTVSSNAAMAFLVYATLVVTPPGPKQQRLRAAPSQPVRFKRVHSIFGLCLGVCELHDLEIQRPVNTQIVKMPSEVSDIKQFIEICRRKDASCTSTTFDRRGPRSQSQ